MIAAHELRLGNWVTLLKDGTVNAYQICSGHDIDEVDGFGEQGNLIPLTPEVLEKCGFSIDSINEYWTHWVLQNGWYISESSHDEYSAGVRTGFCYYGESYLEIKSLHQLQNLYFALTGQELNYKP